MAILICLVVFVLEGCLFIGLALPLIQGKVKPNPWYGVRMRKTMQNPEIWYPVNAYCGRRLILVGVSMIAAAVLFCPLSLIPKVGIAAYTLCWVSSMLIGLIITIVQTFQYLSKF